MIRITRLNALLNRCCRFKGHVYESVRFAEGSQISVEVQMLSGRGIVRGVGRAVQACSICSSRWFRSSSTLRRIADWTCPAYEEISTYGSSPGRPGL